MNVKVKIKSLMKERGLTIYALAQKSDLSQACISNWYNERNYEPSLDALQKICKGLDISLAELFCDENEEMFPVDENTRELLSVWLKLGAAQKQAVIGLINSFLCNK